MVKTVLLSEFWSCGKGRATVIAKIWKRIIKIKEIYYQFSLNSIDAKDTVEIIMAYVNYIRVFNNKVAQDNPILKFLTFFDSTLEILNKMRESIRNRRELFISDISAFYLLGFTKYNKVDRINSQF